jgi:hypothetical protein
VRALDVLEARLKGIATCLVSEDGQPVTEFMLLPESRCVVEGTRYRLARGRTSFTIEGPGGVLAVAERTGRWEFTVSGAASQFQLRRVGRFGGRWELNSNGVPVGRCQSAGFGATGDLPAELPLAMRVFVLYTTLV